MISIEPYLKERLLCRYKQSLFCYDKGFLILWNSIDGVINLINSQLSLLAESEENFKSIGVEVIGSLYDFCEMSLDKYRMYEWLIGHDYRCARFYMDKAQFFDDVEGRKKVIQGF